MGPLLCSHQEDRSHTIYTIVYYSFCSLDPRSNLFNINLNNEIILLINPLFGDFRIVGRIYYCAESVVQI